jgi:DNA-directed RNA polymerase specialized sigma24 family protein
MYDPKAESSKRVLAEIANAKTREILQRIAKTFTSGNEADAEDLIADSLARALDPEKNPWEKRHTFFTFMTFLMRHVWYERITLSRVQHEVVDSTIARDENTRSAEPRADAQAHRARTYALHKMLGDKLLAELASKNPLAVRLFQLGGQGIDEPAEQAAILEVPVEDVYRANEVLRYHGQRIREEWEQSEERRMKELRDKDAERRRTETRRDDDEGDEES